MGLKQIDELAAKGELTAVLLLEDMYETLTDALAIIRSGMETNEPWAPHPAMGAIAASLLDHVAFGVLQELDAWNLHEAGKCSCTPEQHAQIAQRQAEMRERDMAEAAQLAAANYDSEGEKL